MSRSQVGPPIIEREMAAKINYEDNIFFLTTLTRDLSTGVKLDIDPDVFRDKILEDVLFVDTALIRMYESLQENRRLIRRLEYLRALLRAERVFIDFLEAVTSSSVPFSEHLEPFFTKLRATRREHANIAGEMDLAIRSSGDEDSEDLVSEEEFRTLLEPYSDTEDQEIP